MVQNGTIVLKDGNRVDAEIVSFFRFKDTGKKYVYYTLNEKDENNLVKIYVTEVEDSVGNEVT